MEMRQELPVRNGMPRRVTVLPWGSRKGGWRTQLWAGGKLSSPGGTGPSPPEADVGPAAREHTGC